MKKEGIRVCLGESSRRFLPPDSAKPCVIAGIIFDDIPGFQHESDGDVIFHALCNAISSLTHVPILCTIAQDLCTRDGITDSEVYLKEALKTLNEQKITSISISLEAKRPTFKAHFFTMRQNIARVLHLDVDNVGISAIYGDGLTDCGIGEGVRCSAIIVTEHHS